MIISDIRDITAEMLENLDVDFLNTYFNLYLGAYENNGKIQSNKKVSIRRKMSSVKSLYAFMTENELILKNPMLRIKPPKVTDKEIIYLNSEETHDFLKTVKHGKSNSSSMQEKISITGTLDGFSALHSTRTQVGGMAENGALFMEWSVGDRVGVFGDNTVNAAFTGNHSSPAAQTTFSGSVTVGDIQVCYYPFQ